MKIGEQIKEKLLLDLKEQVGVKDIEMIDKNEGARILSEKYYYRGDIWWADLGTENKEDSEQAGFRPIVIIQNNLGNIHSPTVIVASITGSINKAKIPTHQSIHLEKDSVIMFEQIFTISKKRLKSIVGKLTEYQMVEANYRMGVSLGLIPLN